MHSLFLLRLSEELPAALTHALHALCDPESMRGLDLGETRAQLVARRERLILEQEQAAQVLLAPPHPRLILLTLCSRAHVPMCAYYWILHMHASRQVLKTFHRVRTRLGASRPLKAAMPSARAASAVSRS